MRSRAPSSRRFRSRTRPCCSWACAQAAKRGRPNPNRARKATRVCDWCGEDVTRPQSDFHGEKAFCNYRCMAEWQSEFGTGEVHPRWKGGVPRSYGIGWRAAKRAALERANGQCVRCRKRPPRDVHHLLPVRFFARLEHAHFDSNLIAVCLRCHTAEHRKLEAALPLLNLLVKAG